MFWIVYITIFPISNFQQSISTKSWGKRGTKLKDRLNPCHGIKVAPAATAEHCLRGKVQRAAGAQNARARQERRVPLGGATRHKLKVTIEASSAFLSVLSVRWRTLTQS